MIRIGVIGASGVGAAHIAALRDIPDLVVTGVAGTTQASAAAAAERFGVERAFRGAEAMIASGTVDGVHVCSPNDLHAAAVRLAIQAGLHVVCEKPLTASLEDAMELAALDSQLGAAAVCYNYRYAPLFGRLARMVADGDLGTVHSVRAAYLQNWQLTAGESWRNDPERSGPSRVLADIGTHLLDLVETAIADEVSTITANFLSLTGNDRPGRDDMADALVRFRRGGLGSLSLSQVSPGHMNTISIEIDGGLGTATWQLNDRETLRVVRSADAQSLRLDGHAEGRDSGRFWRSESDAHARLVRLFRAFYFPLLGRNAELDGSPVSLPGFREAARHVELMYAAAAGIASPAPEGIPAGLSGTHVAIGDPTRRQ